MKKKLESDERPIIPTVWITKYALTKGIEMVENAEHCVDINEGMISIRKGYSISCYHGEGRDWHRTLESARNRVLVMIAAKLKTIDKQREQLLSREKEMREMEVG